MSMQLVYWEEEERPHDWRREKDSIKAAYNAERVMISCWKFINSMFMEFHYPILHLSTCIGLFSMAIWYVCVPFIGHADYYILCKTVAILRHLMSLVFYTSHLIKIMNWISSLYPIRSPEILIFIPAKRHKRINYILTVYISPRRCI